MAVIGSSHWTEAASCRWRRDEQTQITPHSSRSPFQSGPRRPHFWCFSHYLVLGAFHVHLRGMRAHAWLGNLLGALLGARFLPPGQFLAAPGIPIGFKIKMHLVAPRLMGVFFKRGFSCLLLLVLTLSVCLFTLCVPTTAAARTQSACKWTNSLGWCICSLGYWSRRRLVNCKHAAFD